jgi:hypothetical protein
MRHSGSCVLLIGIAALGLNSFELPTAARLGWNNEIGRLTRMEPKWTRIQCKIAFRIASFFCTFDSGLTRTDRKRVAALFAPFRWARRWILALAGLDFGTERFVLIAISRQALPTARFQSVRSARRAPAPGALHVIRYEVPALAP